VPESRQLPKVTLNKTITARKLSKTGVPTSDPESAIPFGAIIERVERDSRGMANFRYLMESYQCPYEMLASAVDGGTLDAGEAELPRGEKAGAAAAAPAPAPKVSLEFETVATNIGPAARASVPGGWLVWMERGGLIFYPDSEHEWS
jgi:hypothetical protein